MENFYFPLFLVALAAVVMWLFRRNKGESKRDRQSSSLPSGRMSGYDRERFSQPRPRGAAARVQSGAGHGTRGDIFQPRKERVHKESFAQSASHSGVYHAGYIGPHAHAHGSGAGEIRDQDVSDAEHLSMDEYLAKREREREQREAQEAAEKENEFSMTAMKYESGDDSEEASGKEASGTRKSASFKP